MRTIFFKEPLKSLGFCTLGPFPCIGLGIFKLLSIHLRKNNFLID